ncbi:MAG: hypothetical protein MUC47_11990 [Candidatus Kapabacteria bacterium]|nr:hypothetical protein [Candidatus Kapabacteria bacterium]
MNAFVQACIAALALCRCAVAFMPLDSLPPVWTRNVGDWWFERTVEDRTISYSDS